jgi:hypothetical protein
MACSIPPYICVQNGVKGLTNITKQDKEESKRIILKEYPDISQSTLEFVLSIPAERNRPKVSELETVYATKEQQEEMERLLRKNKK